MNLLSYFPQNDWAKLLEDQFQSAYWHQLEIFLQAEYDQQKVILPKAENIFKSFALTTFQQTKVVILGQDPYHGEKQAMGLAFSVPRTSKIPPSLRNIFKELQHDLELAPATHGDLSSWASQGVLLINTVLTVEEAKAGSHSKKGWETFTDRVIHLLNQKQSPVLFVLWGNPAQAKSKLIDSTKHTILKAAHPSPLAAHQGFFGCRHFSQINHWLLAHGHPAIDWKV